MSVWLCAGIAILLSGVSQLALRPALRLIQTPDNIFADAAMYLHICYGGIVIIMAYNLLAAILRALGDGKTPLYAMVIAAVLNIGLDFLFVVGFHWGIAGAAVATVIAQCCSAGVCLRAVRRISLLQMDAESWKPDGAYLKKLLRLGMPLALQNIIISVGGLGVQSIINGFGYLFIAGFTAANKLYGLVELAAVSFGFAAATYVGQNLGARQYARIRRGVRVACLMAFCTSLVVSAVTLFFGHSLIGLFVSKTEPQYDMVLQTAYTYLTVLCVPLSVLYLLHVYRSALQGLGNMVIPLISGFAELFFPAALCRAASTIWKRHFFYAETPLGPVRQSLLIVSYYLQIRTLGRTDAPLHDRLRRLNRRKDIENSAAMPAANRITAAGRFRVSILKKEEHRHVTGRYRPPLRAARKANSWREDIHIHSTETTSCRAERSAARIAKNAKNSTNCGHQISAEIASPAVWIAFCRTYQSVPEVGYILVPVGLHIQNASASPPPTN